MSTNKEEKPRVDPSSRDRLLGTFGGVFTPSILTILGVIMYLRFGWVVGNVGLIGTLIIVTLSTSITFLTSLSIASIATDQKVKAGGAYYMISRSLGIETGGAVGIPLYIAQTLSIALYTLGFAESFVAVFPFINEKLVALFVTLAIGIIAIISANVAIKAQYFIMTAIGLSLLSLLFGKPIEPTTIEMHGVPPDMSVGFWRVFAVFFPAVTGIMAGVNMSGDLKEPRKSIPRGTFLAVGTGYLIYMLIPLILASRADAQTLVDDSMIMRKISFWGDAILLGVWGATLSSALGSILGAPRVLQALARDKVLPRFLKWLGKGRKEDDNPVPGTILTILIALVAVYYSNLDLIAPILTMFFLTTYGVLNVSAGLEKFLGSPSFRPTFKVHWGFSLLGTIGCAGVMLLINPLATVIAVILVILTFFWLEQRDLRTHWGDVRQGIWMAIARAGILRIKNNDDPKNWYPHLLVLSGAPTNRWHLIAISQAFISNKGLMTVASILSEESVDLDRKQKMEANIREFLLGKGVNSLVRVITAPNPYQGGELLAEVYGLGNLYPNTLVVGDSIHRENIQKYARMISRFYEAKRNVLIIRENEFNVFGQFKRIDIWSAGLKGNGALMIILAYLLTNSHDWNRAEIVLKIMLTSDLDAINEAEQNLKSLISGMRLVIKIQVIRSNGKDFYQVLKENSRDADLVFLGLAKPGANYAKYVETFLDKTSALPTTIYTLVGQEVDFSRVLH